MSAQIDVVIALFTAKIERLDTIPGVNGRTAEVIVAEIEHTQGRSLVRAALTEAALAAGPHTAKGAFAAWYRRVMRHREHRKAVTAMAHAILVAAYHLLASKTT